MSNPLISHKLEIQQEDMDGYEGTANFTELMQLLVVNLVEAVPVQHFCGSMLPEDQMPGILDGDGAQSNGNSSGHFEEVLKHGDFVIEIPNQSFHTEVIVAKLLRAAPAERLDLLLQIMREKEISRLLIIAPADGNRGGLKAP